METLPRTREKSPSRVSNPIPLTKPKFIGFREDKFKVLVATDVASRGLDIPHVDLVVQIQPPENTESYIHRSGRTARAGKYGACVTFFTDDQSRYIS